MSVAATNSRSGKSSSNGFTQLANGEHLESIVKPEEGLISRRIFADPEIYQMEIDRIFGRGWFFLGHESEIPNPGDLVSRPCGIDPAILVRDDEGVIRAFLNSCRHRGMRVCRTDRENARFLRCPYHGWAYRNNGELASAGAENHYGEGELEKSELGRQAARQCHRGPGPRRRGGADPRRQRPQPGGAARPRLAPGCRTAPRACATPCCSTTGCWTAC